MIYWFCLFILHRLHAVAHQKRVIGHEVQVPCPGFCREGYLGQA